MVRQTSKPPDHAILNCSFSITTNLNSEHTKHEYQGIQAKKFKVNKIPENFMSDENVANELIDIISTIATCQESQNELDSIFVKQKNLILDEMEAKLPTYDSSSRQKHKNFKYRKPFWNDSLHDLFQKVTGVEKKLKNVHTEIKKETCVMNLN